MKNHIHIGYGDSANECLLEAIKNYNLPGDASVPSRDDFTQGPINDWLDSSGIHQRIAYWESIDQVLGLGMNVKEFSLASLKILDDIEADEITLWVGDSCHDILATGWLLSYFSKRNLDWYIIDLGKVDAQDLLDDVAAVNLALYTPDKIKGLYTYRKKITNEHKVSFISIWQKACTENSAYRIQKNDKIISVDENHYDDYILSCLNEELESFVNIIRRIMKDGQHRISDTTIQWNIRKLIDQGRIEGEGDLKSLDSYFIKRISKK